MVNVIDTFSKIVTGDILAVGLDQVIGASVTVRFNTEVWVECSGVEPPPLLVNNEVSEYIETIGACYCVWATVS